ncbi:MAG: hypothetical protein ABJ201_09790, partial [Nisaea sp.]
DILTETLLSWEKAFKEADVYAHDPGSTLKNWDKAKSVLEALSGRIPWLEDGWAVIFAMWENALHEDHDNRLQTVSTILSGLPLMPRDEVASDRRPHWMEFAKRLSLLAARNEQRSQNDIGIENMLRQEQVLARSLG